MCCDIVKTEIMSYKTMPTKDVDVLFKEYTAKNEKRTLKNLKGKIRFRDDYDYKLMREAR